MWWARYSIAPTLPLHRYLLARPHKATIEHHIDMPDDELAGLTPPTCEECLHALEVAGTEAHPYWWCPECKVARLS
jgi:hypothetical protein